MKNLQKIAYIFLIVFYCIISVFVSFGIGNNIGFWQGFCVFLTSIYLGRMFFYHKQSNLKIMDIAYRDFTEKFIKIHKFKWQNLQEDYDRIIERNVDITNNVKNDIEKLTREVNELKNTLQGRDKYIDTMSNKIYELKEENQILLEDQKRMYDLMKECENYKAKRAFPIEPRFTIKNY